MKLIIMTKSTFFVEEDKILTTLFDEGMDCLHLNKPGSIPIYSERLLSLLPEDYYRKVIVHDHFYLKDEYGLGGIHINDATQSAPDGYKGNISRTCHTIEEIPLAKKNSKYVILRNTFNSLTDTTKKAAYTIEELKKASKEGLIDKKVYALSGVNIENIRIAKELGFGGVVICGDLWNKFDIHNQQDYKDIISHFERLRKAID
jgi:thiamine-phosphate pyrophosphorylase